MNLVQIARGILVQDDDIGTQPLQAPVLLRLKDLTHERHIVVADHAHEQHRQIAGDAVRPQTGLSELVRRNRVRARPQRAVGEQHSRRQAFEQQRLVRRNPQMTQTALRVREGKRECARGRARVAVLLGKGQCGLSIRGDARGEAEAHRRSWYEPDPLAEAEDRIQHDAGGA